MKTNWGALVVIAAAVIVVVALVVMNQLLVYDKIPEIGPIHQGELFFGCVSATELNPPEGTECEHRITSHTFHTHNIVASTKSVR